MFVLIRTSNATLVDAFRRQPVPITGDTPHWMVGERRIFEPSPSDSTVHELPGDSLPDRTRVWTWNGTALVDAGPVPDPPGRLNDAKRAKREEVLARLAEAEKAGFVYLGRTYATDSRSCIRIMTLAAAAERAIAASQSFSCLAVDIEDRQTNFDGAETVAWEIARQNRFKALSDNARSLRQTINNATTSQDASAVDTTTGWSL